MGHSFFRPGAEDLDILAPYLDYDRHSQYRHSAGGHNGDPGSIWRDVGENEGPKAEIKKGSVELIGLTSYSENDGDSDYEDYVTWIDFTLQYNADSLDTVVIFVPWDSYKLHPNYNDYRARIDEVNVLMNVIIQDLRDAYPELTILHIPGAEIMARLWKLYDDGMLGPEVEGVWKSGDRDHLQIDNIGHAGYVLEDAIGLVWQQTIYPETDIRTVNNPPTYQKDWTYDLRQLAYETWTDETYAHRYNDDPIGPTAPDFYTNPVVESDATEDLPYDGSTLADNASDANDDALSFAKVSGPNWLSVAVNGDISGTPKSANLGLNSFVVSVSDGEFTAVEATLEINVQDAPNPDNTAPVFISSSMTSSDAMADQAYSDTIAGSATDADGDPLTYSKVSGAQWLNVAANGSLSGTPNPGYIGANSATVMVSDGDGGSDTATLSIYVNGAPDNDALIDDGFESFNSTGWVTDWKENTSRPYSDATSLKGNAATNDLESPEMDISAFSSVTLSFRYYTQNIDPNDDVVLMLWNGNSYTTVAEIGDDADRTWLEYNGSITTAQYPQFFKSDFKFKIEASSLSSGEAIWIDDMLLIAE